MKDPQITYKEKLENILNLITVDILFVLMLSQNLTKFAWTVELEDKVLISEVLESMFNQMDDTAKNYSISENIVQQLQKDLGTKMED